MVYLKHREHSASDRARYFDLGYKESNDVKQANLELSWAHIFMFLPGYCFHLRFAKLGIFKRDTSLKLTF